MSVGLILMLLSLTSAGQMQEGDPVQLDRSVDNDAYQRCARGLVGFRNVPVQCTVTETGALGQCELLTENRSVLRYRDRFECMASAVTVTYPDGTPAVGRSIRMNFGLVTGLSSRTRYEEALAASRE